LNAAGGVVHRFIDESLMASLVNQFSVALADEREALHRIELETKHRRSSS